MNDTQFPQKKSTQNLSEQGLLIATGWNECVDALKKYLSGNAPALWVHPSYLVRRQGWAPMAVNGTLDQIAPSQIPLFRGHCQHEWIDNGEFTLHCTKCDLTINDEPYGWVQTHGPAINHFTQEWDVVEEWEAQGIKYKAMYDKPGV